MYVDYSKVIVNDLKSILPEEKIEQAKLIAKTEKVNLKRKHDRHLSDDTNIIINNRAIEIAYLGRDNTDKSETEKALIASNIVFDNNERFVEILKNGNLDKQILEKYIILINIIKNKVDNNISLNEVDKKYIKIIDIFTKKLVILFSKYYNLIKPYIIINKITEILSLNPELLENKNKHTR